MPPGKRDFSLVVPNGVGTFGEKKEELPVLLEEGYNHTCHDCLRTFNSFGVI